jgi:hypothetical protein
MKCDECKVIGFSLEELLPDGLCNKCRSERANAFRKFMMYEVKR